MGLGFVAMRDRQFVQNVIWYGSKTMVDSEIYPEHTELKGCSIVIERPYFSTAGLVDDRITMCVDNNNSFWPCIIRLTENEAKYLIEMLEKAILHTDKESQFYEEMK